MIEIECPTCENVFIVPRKLSIGDRLECTQCGENLRIDGLEPLELSYWDEEDEEVDADDYQDSYEQMLEKETDYSPTSSFEDEENQDFRLPDRSSFLNLDDDEFEDIRQ